MVLGRKDAWDKNQQPLCLHQLWRRTLGEGSLSQITSHGLSCCTKMNEAAQVKREVPQEDSEAPATMPPTATVPFQGSGEEPRTYMGL